MAHSKQSIQFAIVAEETVANDLLGGYDSNCEGCGRAGPLLQHSTASYPGDSAQHKCCDSNTMSFRQKRDDWDEFLSRNHNAIALCGVPDIVIRDKRRFLVFLDHGYDEWGWAENNHAFFDSKILTDDQIGRLAKLVGDNIDERYGRIIASRWMRNEENPCVDVLPRSTGPPQ